MGYARKRIICLDETPYYHVIARCVRRSWLWGFDEYTGKDYSHRKAWVLERLKYLADSFAIDVCAYAVMSNHYHLVLHVDQERAAEWTSEQVVDRWSRLYKLPTLIELWRKCPGDGAVREEAQLQIEQWRAKLSDISRYMACLDEYLARRANAEDQCTGRFWEGRFKSQALLDEPALVTAMAYVDLNPLRAGIADLPEDATFTSIRQRILELRAHAHGDQADPPVPLLPFRERADPRANALPFTLTAYLQLLDWSGRAIRPHKLRATDRAGPPILQRLNVDTVAWVAAMQPKGNVFGRALGRVARLRLHANALGQAWVKGLRAAERLYRTS